VGDRLDDEVTSGVFIVGFSAGAAMAAAALAAYPELFEAGALFAGVPVGCASDVTEALGCMSAPPQRDQDAWAAGVLAGSDHGGDWPRVAVWHGNADLTVSPANAAALAAQWRGVHDVVFEGAAVVTEGELTVTTWGPPDEPLVQRAVVANLGHALPTSSAPGCGLDGDGSNNVDVCATRSLSVFFGINETTTPTPTPDDPAAPAACRCAETKSAGGATGALLALFVIAARRPVRSRRSGR
jgi:poly(3-hydroxybutyrate) depolymerase